MSADSVPEFISCCGALLLCLCTCAACGGACTGAGGERMHALGMADSSLAHITRKEYVLNCNWKVFADNYLDGGYHVRS